MAKAYIKHNFSAVSQKVIAVWYENNAPSAEIDRLVLNAPHVEGGFTADNLNPVMHSFKFYQSSDGTTLETLLVTLDIDASIYNEVSTETFEYVVDRGNGSVITGAAWSDPISTQDILNDERLDGYTQDDMLVTFRGTGPRLKIEYDLVSGGGIQLKDGETFAADDALWITIYKNVGQQTNAPVMMTGNDYAGVSVIAEDIDFDSAFYNHLIVADFSVSVGTVNVPALSLIPNGTKVSFNTHGGSQNYLAVQFASGDAVKFNDEEVNVIHLAKGETIKLFFYGGGCYVVGYEGNAKIRGSVHRDTNSARAGGYLLADESTGVLSKADYPALYSFIENLPVGVSVSLSSWGTSSIVNSGKINQATVYPNKTKFGIDTIAETFRVPHLAGIYGRFSASGELAGLYTHDKVGKFEAGITIKHGHSYTGGPNVNVLGNGGANQSDQSHPSKVETGNTETTVKSFNEIPFIIL